MKKLSTIFMLLLCLFSAHISAQNGHLLELKNGTIEFTDNAASYAEDATLNANEVIDDHYYRLIRFQEIPKQELIDRLKSQDVQLLEYLSDYTYLASFPTLFNLEQLPAFQIRSIREITPDFKVDSRLKAELTDRGSWFGNIELMLRYHADLPQKTVQEFCAFDKIELLEFNGYNSVMKISIPRNRVEEISKLAYVAYLDLTPGESIPDDTGGRSLHRANAIDADFPSGRHYNGEGVAVLTRDDGAVGPHIDFQGRINQDFVGPSRGSHGDGVSGIFAGAGNLDPSYKGMANGSELYILDYSAGFLDQTMNLFFERDVLVTNSSYSNSCNAGYTSTTITVEQQLYQNPTLMHVFSAGNSNGLDCDYGAGDQWGNVTGGHKQAKNCLTTANLFVDQELATSSSRGPAHDGRIKPDISAHGQGHGSTDPNNSYSPFGGTSGAAPGIAGVTAMLHQAYRENNSGEIAPAALLKAAMLNTANDLGNKGPDFKFGWGHVNALRAATTIEDQRWLKATARQGETNTHTIEIPDGVIEARIMTYWPDPPASEQTSRALINDINTLATDANGTEYLPWILDPTPNPANLDLPATKGVDNLNNMEQVAIANPAAGTYTLNVSGDVLPMGDHDYYVVWEFRTAEITVVYPIGGEHLIPGNTEWVRWDAENTGDAYTIDYSPNNGANWINIATVDGSSSFIDWTVPNAITTGEALVRISRGGAEGQSVAPFSIAAQPTNLEISSVCLDYVDLKWTPAPGAESYRVYQLGSKFMEEIASVTGDSARIVVGNTSVDLWFAIDAIYPNGAISERTVAIGYSGGIRDCILEDNVTLEGFNNPVGGFEINCETYNEAVEILLANNGMDPETNIEVGYRFDGGTAVVETITDTIQPGETYTYAFTERPSVSMSGVYQLDTWSAFIDDLYPFDDSASTEVVVYTGQGEPLAFTEDFEGLIFPKQFWQIDNDDDDVTWTTFSVTGSDGLPTQAAFMAFRQYTDNPGAIDRLSTIPLDFTGVSDSLYLFFDVAHNRNNNDEDGLQIEISTNCGESFDQVLYEKYGDDLETENFVTGTFFPSFASQWRKEYIDLSDYVGMTGVIIRFNAINDTGNSLFLDNINIRRARFSRPVADFSVSDTEVCLQGTLEFVNNSQGDLNTYLWNFGLGSSPGNATGVGPHTVQYLLPRTVVATLIVSNPTGADTMEQTITVVRLPTANYTFDVVGEARVNFTSSTNTIVDYLWEFGDGMTSTEKNPTHVFPGPGDYDVLLTVSNSCGTMQRSQTVTVIGTGIFDPTDNDAVRVLPNPNNGAFDLILNTSQQQDLRLRLMDVRGKQIVSKDLRAGVGENRVSFAQDKLPSGIYILQLEGASQSRSLKVVVE